MDYKNLIINADLNPNIAFKKQGIDLFDKSLINLESIKIFRPPLEASFLFCSVKILNLFSLGICEYSLLDLRKTNKCSDKTHDIFLEIK